MRLIDADALEKACSEMVRGSNNSDFIPCPTWNNAMELIDNAPTVDTYTKDDLTREYLKGYNDCKDMNERPQGEWIPKHLWDNTHVWVCSKCGNRNTHGITVEKACWKCGVEMKGGAEE